MLNNIFKFSILFFVSLVSYGQDYSIATCQDLQNIKNDIIGDYTLIQDIDCTGFDWQTIDKFSGTLTGRNSQTDEIYSIRNLSIYPSVSSKGYIGGFSNSMYYASINDVIFDNIKLSSDDNANDGGILASVAITSRFKNVTLSNSYFKVKKEIKNIGLLFGSAHDITLDTIRLNKNMLTSDLSSGQSIGLMVGNLDSSQINHSEIADCSFKGNDLPRSWYATDAIGGLVGGSRDISLTHNLIKNSHMIIGDFRNFGGLIGEAYITEYSSGNNVITLNKIDNVQVEGSSIFGGGLIHTLYFSPRKNEITKIEKNEINNLILNETAKGYMSSDFSGLIGYVMGHGTNNHVIEISNNATLTKVNLLSRSRSTGLIGGVGIGIGLDKPVFKVVNNYSVLTNLGNKELAIGLLPKSDFYNLSLISGNFWNKETSGAETSGGGDGAVALSDAEMKTADPYIAAGWDFENIWEKPDNSYPILK